MRRFPGPPAPGGLTQRPYLGAMPKRSLNALSSMLAANNARIALESGVTSVVCSSTPYAIDASLKLAIEDGITPGPRIKAAYGRRSLISPGDWS